MLKKFASMVQINMKVFKYHFDVIRYCNDYFYYKINESYLHNISTPIEENQIAFLQMVSELHGNHQSYHKGLFFPFLERGGINMMRMLPVAFDDHETDTTVNYILMRISILCVRI